MSEKKLLLAAIFLRKINRKIFSEKYTITFTIFIIEYFIACPFALRYANGITTSASNISIHKTKSRYWASIPVNSEISTLKIDAIA